ncbi:MAG TPA: tripartite tricarboxylate transporter substrate binding protein [Terriglobales bacterium]|nr:tripartite tricarboxylate transporter substrate binding protein [Terriglobales bacterium]
MTLSRRTLLQIATTAALMSASRRALALSYPIRPVRVIVPYAPGGPTDILARLTAQKLSEELAKQFYVENIPGAGGNIGMGQAARSAPDGYSLVVVPPNVIVNPALYANVPYDPYKDFDPVTIAVTSPTILAVHPSLSARSVQELVSLVKAQPGKYSFASPGVGTPPHLVGELFRLSFALDLVHVPFNGAGPAVGSAIGGHTPVLFSSLPPTVPQIKEGKLRALAVMSKDRSSALPDVPSIAEAGYPDITGEGWFAFLVPAGTPKDITTLLQHEIVKVISLPDVKQRMDVLGFETVGNTPEECAEQFKSEGAKWMRVIKQAGIKAQ